MQWIRQPIEVEHDWLGQKKLTTHSHPILRLAEEEVGEEDQMDGISRVIIAERKDTLAAIVIEHKDKVKTVKEDPWTPNLQLYDRQYPE